MTGGSAGLGLALAVLLTKKGADVSIVARNEERLKGALEEMEVTFVALGFKLTTRSYYRLAPGSSSNTEPNSQIIFILLE